MLWLMFHTFALINLFDWKCQSLRTPSNDMLRWYGSWGWKGPRISRPYTRTLRWLETLQSRERLVSVDWGGTFTAPHRPFNRHGNWISNQCFTLRFMRWSTILLEPSQEYPSGLSKLENAGCMSNAENSHAFLPFSHILWTRCFLRPSEKSFLTGILHMALKHRTNWKTVTFDFMWKCTY